MKIRRKKDHASTAGDEPTNSTNHFFYSIMDNGELLYWFKEDWELVPPEPEWEDVTKQLFAFSEGQADLYTENGKVTMITCHQEERVCYPPDHQWRKVEAYVIDELICDPDGFLKMSEFSEYKTIVLQVWKKKGN